MKSVLPIAAGILSVGVFIYFYMKQRDKDKKKKHDNDGILDDKIETLEFNVTNEQVPLIVGRNSVILKSIEEKTSTTIRFREGDKDNQICSIKGKAANVKTAKKLVDAEAEKPIVLTDEILIPINSIEGYSGSVLQEICQKSSAKVWVDPGTRKQQSDTRRVLITGTKEQVDLAKKLIEEKINETPTSESNDEKKEEVRRSPRGSTSPYASNSSITTTESPREIMIPTPEKLKSNDGQLEVFVSAVASPSRFWVQLCGPQSSELDFLVDAMTEYYNIKENQELHNIREPYLGQIVAAMYLADNKWYRAEIIAIQPNETNELVLDVYFLDYGDQQYVTKKDILELRADFLSLRFQAIECFLAHVQPNNTSSKFEEWDKKAIESFETLVQVAQWKKLISKVVTYKERKSFALQRSKQRESSPIPGVELYEENSDKSIALELVKLGVATISDRFGDLTKSSVLIVADESQSEATNDAVQEEKEDETPASPFSVISSPDFDKAGESTNEQLPSPSPEKELSPPPPSAQVVSNVDDKKSTADSSPPQQNNDENLLRNGKAESKQASDQSDIFKTSGKPAKIKKKKQQITADFLKSEQGSSGNKKSQKNEDWNSLMDE